MVVIQATKEGFVKSNTMAKKQYFIESELVFEEKPTHGKLKDLEGQKFGRLTVIGFVGIENKRTLWFCKCRCGNIKKVDAGSLKKGEIVSCGCFSKEATKERSTTHGHTKNGQSSMTFATWQGMLNRCQNPNFSKFKDYGGRGITVCERWQKFENFLTDMGERPHGKTLDRKDNDKGYFKENCRWADWFEQANNRRNNVLLTHNGKTQSVIQWAKEMGISQKRIYCRISSGWSVEKALTTPPKTKSLQNA